MAIQKEIQKVRNIQQEDHPRSEIIFWIIVIFVLVLFIVMMWQGVFLRWKRLSGQSYNLGSQQEKMHDLESRIKRARDFIGSVAQIPSEDWRRLEQMLPSGPELPALLVELNLIAKEAGWTISLVSFSTDASGVSRATSTLSVQSSSLSAQKIQTFNIRINIRGSSQYEQFKKLLLSFENSLRLISLKEFSYSPKKESFTLILEGYWYASELDDKEVTEILTSLLESDFFTPDLFKDDRFLSLVRLSQDQYVYYPSPVYVKDEVPAAPLDVVAYDPGDGKTILLSWTVPGQDTARVHIFRSTNPREDGQEIASLPASVPYYSDQGVINGQPYYYFLRSSNAEGKMGAKSAVISASAQDRMAPGPVTDVVFDNSQAGTVILRWKNPKDSDFSYVSVYRSLDGDSTPVRIATGISNEQYIDSATAGSGNYYYFLSSTDIHGNESEILSIDQLLSNQIPFK